jgi:DNA repair ATPase RecN
MVMPKVAKVKFKNYQSLKDLELRFGRFTVIKGPSNTGKSSIIRGFKGVFFNQLGNHFVTKGANNSEVIVEFEDNKEIIWRKGDDNQYEINGRVLNKVSRSAPEDVAEISQVREIVLDDTHKYKINFSEQFHEPFLITESEATISKMFSTVSDLGLVSNAIDLCNKDLKRNRLLLRDREDSLKKAQEDLSKYDMVPLYENRVEALQELFSTLAEKSKRLSLLQEVSLSVRRYQSRLLEFSMLPSVSKIFEQLQVITDSLNEDLNKISILYETKLRIEELNGRNSVLAELLEGVEVSADDASFLLESKIAKLKTLYFAMTEINKYHSALEEIGASLRSLDTDYYTVEERLLELQKQVKLCPICGREFFSEESAV